jgi:F-type H+-transporting ATPase subunit epsilon
MPLWVELVSPERRFFAGEAEVVVARGSEGEVGILPGHAPMLISLAYGPLTLRQPGGREVRALVHGGFLEVRRDRVRVLADAAELVEEIPLEEARRQLAEAERRALEAGTAAARAALHRALVRARLAGA